MGQKVNPIGLRLNILRTWNSCWYKEDNKEYSKFLHDDLKIRKYIEEKYQTANISNVVIKRSANKVNVEIYTSLPGVLIGKGGAELNVLKEKLTKIVGKSAELSINILHVKKPEIDATIVANNIARSVEKRVSYKRAMKQAIQAAVKFGALGIRINISGRIGGAEIARMEWYREGRVPLHTLRNDIDYALAEAKTTYGVCGIKVWIYRGNNTETQASKERNVSGKK